MDTMKIIRRSIFLGLCIILLSECNHDHNRMEFGLLQSGSMVSFVRDKTGNWGIEISGNDFPLLLNRKPAQIEVFKNEENIIKLASGYQSVKKAEGAFFGPIFCKLFKHLVK